MAERPQNTDCFDCHDSVSSGPAAARRAGTAPGIATGLLAQSVHRNLACVDCHADIENIPHPDQLAPAQCASCHVGENREYTTSIHGVSHQMGRSAAAICRDCHGAHDIIPVSDSRSPVFKFNLPRTCAKCHSNANIAAEYKIPNPEAPAHYMESIHGRALTQMGLVVAPSCNDCHGVHDIRRSIDRTSHTNHLNIAATCGRCHLGVEAIYDRSVHGQLLAAGDKRGPVCSDCHTAHDIENPTNAHFKAGSDQRCGKCHEDRLSHYRETYHGKAMALGRPNVAPDVAACYDCHGHHDVLPVSNPASRLSSANIVGTCSRCHPGIGRSFTEYRPHANPLDRANYPTLNKVFVFMTLLLVGTFAFFGLHTAFWLLRSIYLYLHDSRQFREAKVEIQKDDQWFTRFTPFERVLHVMVVTSFLLLVVTGMPLKFYYTDWARGIFDLLGGAEVARSLHRFGAIVTFIYFGLHLGALAWRFWRCRSALRDPESGRLSLRRIRSVIFGPDSMVPSMQDWRDLVAHNRWFFGKGARPQFDRWTYWERFDYFAVFWGVFAIGLSGLIMWFPAFFTRFLPGWIINIAHVVHSDEALLAAGFIFTFHFFNTHFRLEKFPMDTVIFSGRISRSELLHERKRWHDRLVASGRLEAHRVRDDWEARRPIARTFGFLFFGLGLVLLSLIIYAMGTRLIH